VAKPTEGYKTRVFETPYKRLFDKA